MASYYLILSINCYSRAILFERNGHHKTAAVFRRMAKDYASIASRMPPI